MEFINEPCAGWGGLHQPSLEIESCDLVILGLPFDGAVSYRPGAAAAPERIRSVSRHIPPTTETGALLSHLRLRDLGNLEPGSMSQEEYFTRVEAAAAYLFKRTVPFFLGGDHSVTIPLLRAAANTFPSELGIVHLDAHLDLCDELGGNRLSHGCTERRARELPGIRLENVYFIGIRSFELQELAFIEANPVNLYTAAEIAERGIGPVADEVVKRLSGLRRLYITLDIDFLDPATAPGTGTPKPGGFSFRELLVFLRALAGLPVIGMDLVEVSPPLDHGDITSFAAQRALTEMWGFLFNRGGNYDTTGY